MTIMYFAFSSDYSYDDQKTKIYMCGATHQRLVDLLLPLYTLYAFLLFRSFIPSIAIFIFIFIPSGFRPTSLVPQRRLRTEVLFVPRLHLTNK